MTRGCVTPFHDWSDSMCGVSSITTWWVERGANRLKRRGWRLSGWLLEGFEQTTCPPSREVQQYRVRSGAGANPQPFT